jgi:hypothetical protein
MKKLGRHLVFQFGCVCLFLAGVLGYLALQQQQFYLLCLSHFSLGLFISTANFYRFAASDRLATDLIPKATAMVISGGVIAAVIAPMLAIQFQQVQDYPISLRSISSLVSWRCCSLRSCIYGTKIPTPTDTANRD